MPLKYRYKLITGILASSDFKIKSSACRIANSVLWFERKPNWELILLNAINKSSENNYVNITIFLLKIFNHIPKSK